MRGSLRRVLLWTVLGSVLLPVGVTVIGGLAALLLAVGDRAGAAICGRVCLAGGVAWLTCVAVSATVGGMLALDVSGHGEGRPRSGTAQNTDDPPGAPQ